MTILSPSISSAFSRVASPLSAAAPRATTQAPDATQALETAYSTHVSLGATAGPASTYSAPKALSVGPSMVWAAAHNDSLSARMLRNFASGHSHLNDLWRGLGGALLRQLATTGTGYSQTLAVAAPPPDVTKPTEGAAAPDSVADADAAKLQALALGDITSRAVKASLTITTRSGKSVALEIDANDGQIDHKPGVQVQVSISGPLTDGERDALATLSNGLDQTLEGLGQAPPQLDFSQLRKFNDNGELTGLDLAINDPNAANRSGNSRVFSLHIDKDKTALSLKRAASELALSIANPSPDRVNGDHRRSAIAGMLAQIDAAAKRGHANAGTVDLFKQAFTQLQAPQADAASPPDAAHPQAAVHAADAAPPPLHPGLEAQVQALQSGLADFEASFTGVTQRTNRFNMLAEQGTIDYRIGQNTSSTLQDSTGNRSIKQVKTEVLNASVQTTRSLKLDLNTGSYDSTVIRNRKTETTVIDTSRNAISGAIRRTDEHRLSVFTSLDHFHVTAKRETPQDSSYVERLR